VEPGNPEEPVTPTGPEGLLAYTGAASVAGIVLAALSLLAAGFTTLALRRRRTGRQG
jgi:LPXTG-motif cell wall-anchored protein